MTFREEQIQENLKLLDFDRIHSVMNFLGWTWKDPKTNLRRVPKKEELIKMAHICMNKALDAETPTDSGFYGAGGFEAEAIEGMVEIRFILDRANILSKKM